jgi:hypothetical protein
MTMEGPVEHFVKLDKLPEGLEFPANMKDRLYFDANAHKLIFRGYMSKAEFDQLSQLTTDWSFRRTLEDLFRLCVPEPEPVPGGWRRVLATMRQFFSRK